MLEKIFKLKENKTKVTTELIAGFTTFMAMSYVIFINPSILSQAGLDYNAVYGATIIASALGTLSLGLIANIPYAQSAGIGLASLFTFTICGTMGYTWQQGLAMVFICAVINLIITLTSLRKKIIKAIPSFMQEAITVGIGLFISYIGFVDGGLLSFKGSTPTLASFTSKSVLLVIIGLIITAILVIKKVKGAYLIGIISTTIIGIPLGITHMPDFSNYTILPSLEPTLMKLDFVGLFTAKSGLLMTFMTIFSLAISDLFDSMGVFIGTGKKAGIFKVNKDGEMPKKLERALLADAVGPVFGAMLGTSNVTTYVESTVGIEAGGRTGLTSVFTALFFLLAMFISPIIKIVPIEAVAPILILIGATMIEGISNIDWKDMAIAIPSFLCIVLMPFSYSITTGIEFGFIFYTLTYLLTKKGKEISPIMYILSILFIINYIFECI